MVLEALPVAALHGVIEPAAIAGGDQHLGVELRNASA